jgi:hypothetical protein
MVQRFGQADLSKIVHYTPAKVADIDIEWEERDLGRD